MATLVTRFDSRLRRLPDLVLLGMALLFVAALAAFKLTAGRDVPIVDFFLIPVAAVGWFAGAPAYGYATALITAAVSVIVSVAATQAPFGATAASGVARMVLYMIVLSFLSAGRSMQLERDREASTDHLTGAANARWFRTLAANEVERSRRYGHSLSLAYIDIDDFKAINDGLGHVEGDHVLLQVSHLMHSVVRSSDVVARLGGDEFVVMMPETGATQARVLVDRLREELARMRASDHRPVTCSIGLVTFVGAPISPRELIDTADELMYEAKRTGKDQVRQSELAGAERPAQAREAAPAKAGRPGVHRLGVRAAMRSGQP
jgi:diguanylate cyclase (GGDEF)-like protein